MPTETQHLEQRVATLQSDLNTKDEQIDALTFSDNDRELSRRSWFDEAKRLEKEVEELRSDVEKQRRLKMLVAEKLQNALNNCSVYRVQLAERDALLEDWHAANATGEVKVSDKAYRIVTRTAAALSASAEPSAAKCKTCNGSKVVDDGELTHSAGGIPYECGPIKCVKDCPDCGDTGLEPCSKHGWKP
ncbi:hypothetical protein Q7O60_16340 [Pseudomonas protegens]|uniref:Uncharacterized protein n=1 Tax=Pseudomonas idahonensis TaxID=2942628 RepID=A0ABT5QER8_9PSED|nr:MULTISPECIES: hypothetical protein [Pseudomonas]MDD1152689.1 hypothetical protein [Pseudomonas idahonensis]MDP9504567.1 hypothetical protein [Pseudomonas protegens]